MHCYTYVAESDRINFKAEPLLEIETFHYGGSVNPPKKKKCNIQIGYARNNIASKYIKQNLTKIKRTSRQVCNHKGRF